MAELPINEAARALGVSVETIRRRLKAGTLAARQDERGRYLVEVPDGAVPMVGAAELEREVADLRTRLEDAERERRHAEELLAEVRRQRDQLEQQAEAQRQEAAALRMLLGDALQVVRALPTPAESVPTQEVVEEAPLEHPAAAEAQPWWKFW